MRVADVARERQRACGTLFLALLRLLRGGVCSAPRHIFLGRRLRALIFPVHLALSCLCPSFSRSHSRSSIRTVGSCPTSHGIHS